MENQLFIPTKINVGLQGRDDTYTGKLGYVIYWDNKGKLRKEGSWESWRWKEGQKERIYNEQTEEWEDTICGPEYAPQAFENVPTEGFVLNKDVGGARRSYGWDTRIEKVRVYDPRNFEFEISIPNLLFILQETSAIKGKGLEGEFVYGWSGAELILLPVGCNEYKTSTNFTELQSKKITKTDMLPGCLYKTKKQVEVMYLGRFNWVEISPYSKKIDIYPAHIFYNIEDKECYPEKGFTSLGERLTLDVAENYSDILEEFQKSKNFSTLSGYTTKPFNLDEDKLIGKRSWNSTYAYLVEDNTYYQVTICPEYEYNGYNHQNPPKLKGFKVEKRYRVDIDGNKINYISRYDYRSYSRVSDDKIYLFSELKNLIFIDLYAILSNGVEMNIDEYFN